MALDTVRDLLGRALLLSGAMNKGEDPDPDEWTDALESFIGMLGVWDMQSLAQPYIASSQFLTVPGKRGYSLGPGGDWDGVRPNSIKFAWFERDTLTLPLKQLQYDEYGDIPVKNVASTNPWGFMYNASYPLGYFVLYPVPSAQVKIILGYDASFYDMTLDSDIRGFPKGYVHVMVYNLAVLLAPEYGKEPPSAIVKEATKTMGILKSRNLKALDAVIDPAVPGMSRRRWDWRIG